MNVNPPQHMWHAYSVHCRDDKRLYFPHGHNASECARCSLC